MHTIRGLVQNPLKPEWESGITLMWSRLFGLLVLMTNVLQCTLPIRQAKAINQDLFNIFISTEEADLITAIRQTCVGAHLVYVSIHSPGGDE